MKLANILILIIIVILYSCSGINVETDYDTQYNYAALKTYNWADIDETEDANVLTGKTDVYERARIAVNRSLMAKGYKIAVNQESDFLVDAYLDIEEIKNVVDNRPAGRGSRGGDLDFYENIVNEGTLIIDIITPDNTYVIWRGVGMAEVSDPDEYETKETKQQRADYIIYQILEEFPPDMD